MMPPFPVEITDLCSTHIVNHDTARPQLIHQPAHVVHLVIEMNDVDSHLAGHREVAHGVVDEDALRRRDLGQRDRYRWPR